jgi:hypothetical protein
MKTLPKQTSISGREKSMFSPEDSHASLLALPAEEREKTITAISGHRCYERFGKLSPLGSLVKTLLESKLWWSPAKRLKWDAQTIYSKRITYTERKAGSRSKKSARNLKQQDIPSNRLIFRLAVSEHPTEEKESGLLQEEYQQLLLTPTAVMIAENPKRFKERAQKNGYRNGTTYGSLASQVMFSDRLPTPNAMDIPHKDMEINERGRRNPKKGKTDHSLGVEDMAVAKLLPTPTAIDKGGGRINRSPSPNAADRPTLALAARKGLLPTPCSIEATKFTKTINPNSQMGQGITALAVNGLLPAPTAMEIKHSNRVKGLKEKGAKGMYSRKNGALRPNGLTDFLDFNNQVGGGTSQLNPLFVEEMMGFPLMWTALPFLSPSGDKNP